MRETEPALHRVGRRAHTETVDKAGSISCADRAREAAGCIGFGTWDDRVEVRGQRVGSASCRNPSPRSAPKSAGTSYMPARDRAGADHRARARRGLRWAVSAQLKTALLARHEACAGCCIAALALLWLAPGAVHGRCPRRRSSTIGREMHQRDPREDACVRQRGGCRLTSGASGQQLARACRRPARPRIHLYRARQSRHQRLRDARAATSTSTAACSLYLQSEAELAAVLAHEIAHITERHASRQDVMAKTSSVASLALGVLAAIGTGSGAVGAVWRRTRQPAQVPRWCVATVATWSSKPTARARNSCTATATIRWR
jgi:hypothetical protein